MKIFYYNADNKRQVAADAPVEADQQAATRVFTGIVEVGSFFGMMLADEKVLQVYMEEHGKVSLEILDKRTFIAETAFVTTPVAEAAIEAAYSSKDIRQALEQFFLKWTVEKIR